MPSLRSTCKNSTSIIYVICIGFFKDHYTHVNLSSIFKSKLQLRGQQLAEILSKNKVVTIFLYTELNLIFLKFMPSVKLTILPLWIGVTVLRIMLCYVQSMQDWMRGFLWLSHQLHKQMILDMLTFLSVMCIINQLVALLILLAWIVKSLFKTASDKLV